MAQMGIYTGNHEIVEIEEEFNPGENYGRNNFITPDMKRDEKDRSLASNDGNISSVEDDLNQLFEIFNRKASSNGSSHKNRAGSSKKNASKKPVKAAAVHSHGHGISERMNLKQAFRGLCLSQASETAAMKRSSKLPRSSEAGKILTMYRNVVVEDNISDHSQDDSREGMLEISLVPEQTTFDSFQSIPGKLPASDLWPSNRNSLTEMASRPTPIQSGRFVESEDSSNVSSTSFSHTDYNTPDVGGSILTQTQVTLTSSEIRNQTPTVSEVLQKQKHMLPPSSSPSAKNSTRDVPRSITRENGNSSALVTGLSPTRKHAPATFPSSSSNARVSPAQKAAVVSTVEAENHKTTVNMPPKEENSYAQSYFDDFHDQAHEHIKSATTENKKFSSPDVFSTQLPLIESVDNGKHELLFSSPTSCGKSSLDMARKTSQQKEIISTSPVAQNQKKFDTVYKEDHAHARSPRRSNLGDKVLDHNKNGVSPRKVVNKEAAVISAKVVAKEHGGVVQDSVKTITSSESPKGKKVSRSTKNAQHLVKPLIKTKNFVKRRSKKKMATDNGSKNIRSEFNNDLYSSPNPIVCPRCQCDVTDALKETDKEYSLSPEDSPISPQESLVSVQESPASYLDSPISPFASLSGEVSSGNVVSDFSTPGPSSDGLSKPATIHVESSSNSKSRDRADFTQSSKTSPVGCSSSTSISEENNITRPSFCDRPHMSKDVRWEAIRHVRSQHGMLGLKNFSLLKKLGCGDIGTVYLAELIGTNCLFAIKVMDCEFLARRKKITRAQTEKEILRMLDHPFLPTLYCQFTSDNLSCLVMEYCPGGDLHVLRQKQPSRCFTEQAARFYVAEVLLALEYLHMLGVVYRDLKPENILVREDGHIMLSDFDLSLRCAVSPTLLVSSSTSEGSGKSSRPHARGHSRCVQPLCIEPSCRVTCFTPKLLSSSKSSKLKKMKSDVAAEMRPLLQLVAEPTSARSNSFVGTHEYLAPEIIKGEGHGSAVDWWTFGIFLYELLYGRTPFKGPGNEETLANVVLQNLKFPDSPFVSLQARDLIDALLVKEPENRLGTERGAAEIKQHPFFNGLNWALIRCAAPPEMPESHNYGMPKPVPNEKNNKSSEYSSGTASAEHLEFEVF